MRPDGLRSYAAQHAEAARGRYAICTDFGNPLPPPAAIPVSAPPPPGMTPPAETLPAAIIPAIRPAVTTSLPVSAPREPADEVLIADLLGNELDRLLGPIDRQQLREALQWTLETEPAFKTEQTFETVVSGHATDWSNGHIAGTIVASPAFTNAAGQSCRKLVHTVTVGRQTHSGSSTACRSDEGWWDLAY